MPPVLDLEPSTPVPAGTRATRPGAAPPGLGIADAVALPFLFVALLVGVRALAGAAAGAFGWGLTGLATLLVAQLVAGPAVLTLGVHWSGIRVSAAFALRRFPLRILPAVIAASLGLASLASRLALLVPGATTYQERVAQSLGATPPLLAILSAVVAAPVLEELLCRGVLLRGLLRRHSAWTAALVTALVFALFHLNPTQAILAFPLGLGLAWLALRTGSVVPGIVAHAAVNGTSVLTALLLLARGFTPRRLATVGQAPAWTLAAALALALGGGFVLWRQLRDYAPVPGDGLADAPRPDLEPNIVRPVLTFAAAFVLMLMVPRELRVLSTSSLLLPESGPPAPAVVAAAGCYVVELPAAVAAELAGGGAPRPVHLRLTTTRYRVGIEHPSRYLVQPAAGGEPLRMPGDTAPVYWIARDRGGVSIVAGRTLLLLRPAGTGLAGSVARYDPVSGAELSASPVFAQRTDCKGPGPSGRR